MKNTRPKIAQYASVCSPPRLGVSPKSLSQSRPSALSGEDGVWKQRIIQVLTEFPRYGYRKVTAELKRRGWRANRKKIGRIMRKTGFAQKRRKCAPKTTDSRHALPTYPNLVKELIPAYPRHIWAADITYVRLPGGFCYVAAIIDTFTKKIVGWSIALHMETSLVVEALEMALEGGASEYHHSDRGGQYCSKEYTDILKANNVTISMADAGISVDNPYAESFNKTLKVEEVYLVDYRTIDDARVHQALRRD